MNGVGCAVGCLWEGLKEAEAVCSDGRAFVWREKDGSVSVRAAGLLESHTRFGQNSLRVPENSTIFIAVGKIRAFATPLWSSGAIVVQGPSVPTRHNLEAVGNAHIITLDLYPIDRPHKKGMSIGVGRGCNEKSTSGPMYTEISVVGYVDGKGSDKLVRSLMRRNHPLVVRGAINGWGCSKWSPGFFQSSVYGAIVGKARFHELERVEDVECRDGHASIPWENECTSLETTLGDFAAWLEPHMATSKTQLATSSPQVPASTPKVATSTPQLSQPMAVSDSTSSPNTRTAPNSLLTSPSATISTLPRKRKTCPSFLSSESKVATLTKRSKAPTIANNTQTTITNNTPNTQNTNKSENKHKNKHKNKTENKRENKTENKRENSSKNALAALDSNKWWGYMDYLHFEQIFNAFPQAVRATRFSEFISDIDDKTQDIDDKTQDIDERRGRDRHYGDPGQHGVSCQSESLGHRGSSSHRGISRQRERSGQRGRSGQDMKNGVLGSGQQDSTGVDDSTPHHTSPSADGSQPALWIGSRGASSRLHYDSYGYNIVAQIHGRKRWTLYSPQHMKYLYPTRIPYEESTVFSAVDVGAPDCYQRFPLFRFCAGVQVTLEPLDALYVPHKWWHQVECLENSVSVNQWISIPNKDKRERCVEGVAKALLALITPKEGLVPSLLRSVGRPSAFLNSGETLSDCDMGFILETLYSSIETQAFPQPLRCQQKHTVSRMMGLLISSITHPETLAVIVDKMLETLSQGSVASSYQYGFHRGSKRTLQGLRMVSEEEAMFLYEEIFNKRAYVDKVLGLPPSRTRMQGGQAHSDLIVLDVGANIGLFSLFCFEEWGPNVRVLAVEPISDNYDCLKHNISTLITENRARCVRTGLIDKVSESKATSGFATFRFFRSTPGESTRHVQERRKRLETIHAKVSSEIQTIAKLQLQGNMSRDSDPASSRDNLACLQDIQRQAQEALSDAGSAEECPVSTLDGVLRSNREFISDAENIDLLKIDVEGDEELVLQGISKHNWRRIKSLVIEVSDVDGRLSRICGMLKTKGFRVFTCNQGTSSNGEGVYMTVAPTSLNLFMVFAVREVVRMIEDNN